MNVEMTVRMETFSLKKFLVRFILSGEQMIQDFEMFLR